MNIKRTIAQFVGAAAIALFSFGAQANLLANPGFEADDASSGDVFGATGWNVLGSNAFTTDGTNGPGALPACCSPPARSGVNSLKVFGSDGAFQSFAATVGDSFVADGWGLNYGNDALAPASSIRLQIAFFDANGVPAGTAAGGNSSPGFNLFDSNIITGNDPQDIWTLMGVGTAPAPDNTAEVQLIVLGLTNPGGAAFFDDVSFDVAPIPVPAAVWLFGSGLLGLVGVARRRRKG